MMPKLNFKDTQPNTLERKGAAILGILYDGVARPPEETLREINQLELISMSTKDFNVWLSARVRHYYRMHHEMEAS